MSLDALPSLPTVLTIAGITVITVLTRAFFFLSSRELPMPAWVERGLAYAPLAALSAVIAPEILMTQGHFLTTWQDARLFATAAGAAFFFWRKHAGQPVLGTIVVGMVVFLALRLGLGW
jgi:branched-subunit amino acid transport protein